MKIFVLLLHSPINIIYIFNVRRVVTLFPVLPLSLHVTTYNEHHLLKVPLYKFMILLVSIVLLLINFCVISCVYLIIFNKLIGFRSTFLIIDSGIP